MWGTLFRSNLLVLDEAEAFLRIPTCLPGFFNYIFQDANFLQEVKPQDLAGLLQAMGGSMGIQGPTAGEYE